MNCSETRNVLSAYLDGELGDEQRIGVSNHLEACVGCAAELARFRQLSRMAQQLSTPPPPEHLWSQVAARLDGGGPQQPTAESAPLMRHWFYATSRVLAVAATVLVAVGVSWFVYHAWQSRGERNQFTANFGQYLEEFRREPDAAQKLLLATYQNRSVDPDQALKQIGYRPLVAGSLPPGYTLASTHVIEMPCCTCVQSVCRRSDGSLLAVFEHVDEETAELFGKRPGITATCQGKKCCLVELDDRIAASWQQGPRHITLIGVKDLTEVDEFVASLDRHKTVLE